MRRILTVLRISTNFLMTPQRAEESSDMIQMPYFRPYSGMPSVVYVRWDITMFHLIRKDIKGSLIL